jgi:hypothetical protein
MVDLLLPVLCAGIALAEAWIRFGHPEPSQIAPIVERSLPKAFFLE